MDDNADAERILLASPPADWRRQLGRPRITTWLSTIQQDLKQHHLTLPEAAVGSEPPSVEDDVDVWRYAILTCMPETTTTTKKAFCSPINQKPRYSSLRTIKFLNVSHNTWVTSLYLKQMSLIFSCVTRRNLTTLKETFSHYIGENTHSTHLKIICLFVKYSVLTAV